MTSRNMMWNGTCSHLPFAGQLRTARLSGFETLSITPSTFSRLAAQGLSARDIRRMAEDEGVRVSHLDPLSRWAPRWVPDNLSEREVLAISTSVDDFLRIAEALECESLSAICTFPAGDVAMDELTAAFAQLCRRAAGFRIDLEFIPCWGLPDLRSAWDVVRAADEPNGGILLDFVHFFRSGSDMELLRSIPSERLHSVQVCDGRWRRGEARTVWQDLHEDRSALGRGEFPVDDLLAVLAQRDALHVVGPEYFSREMAPLDDEGVAIVLDETYWPRVEPVGVTRAGARTGATREGTKA